MLVTSPSFFLFAALVILINRFLPVRFKAVFLLAASFFFYGCWKFWAPLFMAGYALVNWLMAFWIRKAPKFTFPLSLCVNIALFVLLGRAEFPADATGILTAGNIVFPLGFSYYMFRCIGYHADVARKRTEPERNPVKLTLYLCFFPVLVMGPVTRAGEFLPQIGAPARPGGRDVRECLVTVGLALFKKLVIADNIGRLLAPWFESSLAADGVSAQTVQNGGVWFILLVCYIVQLYLDFSAYTDIALAVSRLLGFTVNPNFRAPFLARTISDFWRRWHMGLSLWLSDYLFTPLQMRLRRFGVWATVAAAFATLILSGMWHRFSLNYLAWGAATAFFISLDALSARRRKKIAGAVPKWLFAAVTTAVTFVLSVCVITFVRADSFSSSLHILSRVLNPATYTELAGARHFFAEGRELLLYLLAAIPFVTLSHAIELGRLPAMAGKARRVPYPLRLAALMVLIYAFIFLSRQDADIVGGFIYGGF